MRARSQLMIDGILRDNPFYVAPDEFREGLASRGIPPRTLVQFDSFTAAFEFAKNAGGYSVVEAALGVAP